MSIKIGTPIDVEALRTSAITVTPITVEGWTELAGEDMDGFQYWEPFTYEFGNDTYRLLANNGAPIGVIIDGTLYREWDDYESDWEDDHPDEVESEDYEGVPIDEHTFDALMSCSPHEWGSEGPMMNYWYPLEIDDEAEAAAQLADVPLCVVEVNGTTGLALTGGGMDLSWDICRAYILLGHLPPTHFADLPRQGEDDPIVVKAMLRSLEIQSGWLTYRADRLREQFPTTEES